MTSLPSLFLPHGAPDLILTDHPAKRFLAGLSKRLPAPRAILIISAHWEARRPSLTTAHRPKTVHDFSGWPRELSRLSYPAATDEALIDTTDRLLGESGIDCDRDHRRGFDHGAWMPLKIAFPAATIPVVQISLQRRGTATDHLAIGAALAPLRQDGVLIIGSGSVTHNLSELGPEGGKGAGLGHGLR